MVIIINLEIGNLPKKYYENAPSTGGYQFFVNEGIQSAINIGEMYYPDYSEEQLASFTESLMTFPLYYLFEQSENEDINELEIQLSAQKLTHEIFYHSKKRSFFFITITTQQELLRLLPIMIWQHVFHMNTFWSNNKNAFSIEQKLWDSNHSHFSSSLEETVCLHFNGPTTICHLGYDYAGTDIFSNEVQYFKLEDIQKRLPSFITTEIVEYG